MDHVARFGCLAPRVTIIVHPYDYQAPTRKCRALCDGNVLLFVCLFVRLSLVKFLKSFARWQHLTANGAYRIESVTLIMDINTVLKMLNLLSEMTDSVMTDATPRRVVKTLRGGS